MEIRTFWCKLNLGCRNLGFAYRSEMLWVREHEVLDSQREMRICISRAHSAVQKTRFSIRRTRCEPSGENSVWVAETEVLHTQNEMCTIWCRLIRGCRNLTLQSEAVKGVGSFMRCSFEQRVESAAGSRNQLGKSRRTEGWECAS